MKAAIYARVSTDDKNQNPETQLLLLREHCQRNGWSVYQEYIDQARAKDYQHRTAWDQLLSDARQRRFNLVVVYKLDRAWRSVQECCNQLDEWNGRGIKFVATSQDIDTSTAMGRYFLHTLAAVAELESSLISDRVVAGIRRYRAEGKQWGRPRIKTSSQKICEVLSETRSVSTTARMLSCSVPYIYKVLQPLGINPARLARGELKLSAAIAIIQGRSKKEVAKNI